MSNADFFYSLKFRILKKFWNLFAIKKYYKLDNLSLISFNLEVTKPNKLFFKGRVFIDHDCFFQSNGSIQIGNNCAFARDVKIFTHSYDYSLKEQMKNFGRNCKYKKVYIGNNITVGYNAIIYPGVKIGDNSVIGAGSIVFSDIPENSIVSGNPAKILRKLID